MLQPLPIPALPRFSAEEQRVLCLTALYQSHGFVHTSPPKFEEYALYHDNKNFLDTERILTFTDQSGRLMALKPDVTLSIANAVPAGEESPRKLYYLDEVVRYSPENRRYRTRRQIGLERIGGEDAFARLEVVALALRSLALLGGESAMDLSHLGFVAGLFEDAGLEPAAERAILESIHAKSVHGVAAALEGAGISNGRRERILALAALSGPLPEALDKAKALVRGNRMERAYDELCAIAAALRPDGGQRLNLDFSVVNDLDYYNGLLFRGYLRGVPEVVCGGGGYDRLMRRLGKKAGGIGFAVFLHTLAALPGEPEEPVDELLLYSPGCDMAALLAETRSLAAAGLRVRCEREDADLRGIAYRKKRSFAGGGKPDADR